jgi:hypothetical protein
LDGSLCHAYRRKWKSERASHPVTAVAKAGGWTDITTMLRCYDIPDDDAILAVTSKPKRRREAPPLRCTVDNPVEAGVAQAM